jgi:DNA processing protein
VATVPADPETLARLRLASLPGLSPRVAARLVAHFGSAGKALASGGPAWKAVHGVGEARAALFAELPSADQARVELERAAAADAHVVSPGRDDWPSGLDDLADPPLLLFRRGELTEPDRRGVAIVGSRRASTYGRAQARRLAGDLARLGITVISGLARGVDAAAHRGALGAGGRTVGVLGGGLARFYPPEHVPLAREIAADRGAVLSEFPLDVPPLPHHFPRRNRVIAAMAAVVVVVEASERSGSLITADHALDIGRDVLAVPGRVDSANSAGTHRLLREGAALCAGVDDVLRALGVEPEEATDAVRRLDDAGASPLERRILEALQGDERHADELVEDLGADASEILTALSALELRGRIEQAADGRYGLQP